MVDFSKENWQEKLFSGEKSEEETREELLQGLERFKREDDPRIHAGAMSDFAFQLRQAITKLSKPFSEDMQNFLRDLYEQYNDAYSKIILTDEKKQLSEFSLADLKRWHDVLLHALEIENVQELPPVTEDLKDSSLE